MSLPQDLGSDCQSIDSAECRAIGAEPCAHDDAPSGHFEPPCESENSHSAAPSLANRLNAGRGQLTELRDCADTADQSSEAACVALLLNLIEISECWAANGDDERIQQASELVDFCESGILSLHEAMTGQGDISAQVELIRNEAHARWGEYLGLFDSPEGGASESSSNPWHQVLSDPEPTDTAQAGDSDLTSSESNVEQILSALAGSLLNEATTASPETSPQRPDEGDRGARAPQPPKPTTGRTRLAAPAPPVPMPLQIDNELRSAYIEDAERGITQIEQTLLALETDSTNPDSQQQLCRALHTMKGASASVGLSELARYLHDLEDFVQGGCGNGAEGIDIQPMLRGVDALRAQMRAIAAGATNTVAAASLNEEKDNATAARRGGGHVAAPISALNHGVTGPLSEDSIRVESARLDRLMDLLGELVISRNRRDTQVSRLKQLHMELMRTAGRLRSLGESMNATPAVDAAKHSITEPAIPESDLAPNSLGIEIVNDISEIARSLRELYEPVLDENLATSRLMGQFRHELMELRRLPLSGLFLRLQRAARDAAYFEGKPVQCELHGEHAGLEPSLQERLYEPLLHLVRNAVSHGIESEADRVAAGKPPVGTVTIETRGDPTSFVIEVRDDGRGLDYEAIRRRGLELGLLDSDRPASQWQLAQLTFHPGFSTRKQVTEVSGRGIGLDVVASVIDRMRGQIEVESTPGQGTSVRLRIPLRSSIEHTMVFRVDGQLFALPMQFVQAAKSTGNGPDQIFAGRAAGQPLQRIAPAPVADSPRQELPVVRARDLLTLDSTPRPADEQSLIVGYDMVSWTRPTEIGTSPRSPHVQAGGRIALMVDAVVGPEEVVVRSLPSLFRRHRLIAGVTLSGARELVLLLDGRELIERAMAEPARPERSDQSTPQLEDERRTSTAKVLVVDDSVSVRRTLSRMLERRGYNVTEASDGLEALDLLRTFTFSLVVTDLEMPRLGGTELLAEIRRTRRTRPLPVVVMSSVTSKETQERAMELGANAYFTKPVTDSVVTQLLASVHPDVPLNDSGGL